VDPRPGSLIRCAAVPAAPWRNGGGRTRELRAGGGWRLSVATISGTGQFSAFPGVDRTLVVADGRLALSIGARSPRQLEVGDSVGFPGEAPVLAEPVGGPVLAVNVMAERSRCTAAVQVTRLDGGAPAADAVVLLSGTATVHGERLAPCDAVLDAGAGAVQGDGALVVLVSIEGGQS
jgi:environmental stress-induced protein Ves